MTAKTGNRALYYAPRVLAILGILFISSAALDVFEPDKPALQTIGELIVHLVPSYLLVALLVLSWRHERLGGILFIAVAGLFVLLFPNPVWVNLTLAAPFLATGILFLVHDRLFGAKGMSGAS